MITNAKHTIQVEPCSLREVQQNKKECVNAIGHRRLARLLNLKPHRIQVQLQKGDVAYVITNTSRKKMPYNEPDRVEIKKVTIVN